VVEKINELNLMTERRLNLCLAKLGGQKH